MFCQMVPLVMFRVTFECDLLYSHRSEFRAWKIPLRSSRVPSPVICLYLTEVLRNSMDLQRLICKFFCGNHLRSAKAWFVTKNNLPPRARLSCAYLLGVKLRWFGCADADYGGNDRSVV